MLDDFGRAYLRLALEINKHIDGYIDAYLGPAELKAEVEAGDKQPLDALLDEVARLQSCIPTGDADRQAYLAAALRAMDCSLRIQKGETFDYLDEVSRLYDVQPQKVAESVFTDSYRTLDTLLPGSGAVADRMEAYRKRFEVSADKLLPLIELARDETRRRTQALVDLVPGETVEISLVRDQPWSAYNWYRGNAQSLIEFNVDLPVSAAHLAELFAHEGYPGHHTEGQLKEKRLYQEQGYAEQAAMLLQSPSAVIAEGIATTALEIIFPNGSHHEWNAKVLLPAAGIEREAPEVMRRIEEAMKNLDYVTGNAAILYYSGEHNRAQTLDYLQTYALWNPMRAEQAFRFITDPPQFRAYVFTYTQGYDLIEQAAHGGDKTPLFIQLLTRQMLPSQLAAL